MSLLLLLLLEEKRENRTIMMMRWHAVHFYRVIVCKILG